MHTLIKRLVELSEVETPKGRGRYLGVDKDSLPLQETITVGKDQQQVMAVVQFFKREGQKDRVECFPLDQISPVENNKGT